MKSALALGLLAAMPVWAQQQPASEVPPADTAPAEAKPAAAIDPAAVKKAESLLDETAKAYREAKTLTDVLTLNLQSPMGEQKQVMRLMFGEGTDALVTLPGLSFTALDGSLYIVRDDVVDKYAKTTLDQNIANAMANTIGFAPPPAVLRYGGDREAHVTAWTLEMIENAKIVGHQMVTDDQGASLHEIALQGDSGKGAIRIHPNTKLVEQVTLDVTPPGAPEGMSLKVTLDAEPKASESLPQAIAFDAGARTSVDSLERLEPTPVAVGEMAPDFTLPTLDDQKVTLSELRGSVIVLDFWATWCGPCKLGLPKLDEFATWAQSSGKPIKVYAVDVWERFGSPEETKAKVAEFWKEKGYKVATLLDLDSSSVAKFGFQSIPTTVVVGADGKIANIHTGFSPNMIDLLKEDVEKALQANAGS